MFIVFSPPPPNVHALRDCLTMSLMWLVLSIPSPTYMEKEKGKKTLSKSKNQRKQNNPNLIIFTNG
jgi:hypothetical protein